MAFPVWLSIILLGLTAFAFHTWISCLWTRKDSSGISAYYVLFNLVAATEQFTIILFLLVNDNFGSELVVHKQPIIGDLINLSHMALLWILFLIVFALTLHYLPNDNRVHKYTAVAIYITFLLISVIPEFIDIIAGDPHDTSSDRELLLAWFIIPHITFVNPVVTLAISISFIIQIRRSLEEDSPCLSFRTLATQAIIFALLAISWPLRVSWPSDRIPAFFDSPLIEWYRQIGWPAVDHFVFAIGQAILCYVTRRRSIDTEDFLSGEREPLLNTT
ncbi:hypothetical protein PENSTE_c040G05986 [Penicillium steckii]|uniref:Uncharacterized protein n=1 Tax=Penicillium steckii TaxID=303698 RepID=A0A1V6SIW9_9EURO|nr:hypothetical protein PENSTE_c040G05986 [Penicillium steckii]